MNVTPVERIYVGKRGNQPCHLYVSNHNRSSYGHMYDLLSSSIALEYNFGQNSAIRYFVIKNRGVGIQFVLTTLAELGINCLGVNEAELYFNEYEYNKLLLMASLLS